MKFILAVLFTLALPFTASAQYYRFDPSIQQRSQDMMQQQQQLEMQQQQLMPQDHTMQGQNKQLQMDLMNQMNLMYQQQQLDSIRQQGNYNYGMPHPGRF
jgi:hypothetical protein